LRLPKDKIEEFAETIIIHLEGYSDEKPVSDVKSDPGNRTIYGISTAYWPEVGKLYDNNQFNLKAASSFLIKNFYTNFSYMSKMPPSLQFLYFDARIHGEERELTILVQYFINKVLKDVKGFKALAPDGKIGPLTFKGIGIILEYNMLDDFFEIYSKAAPSISKILGGRTEISQLVNGLEKRDFVAGYENRIKNRITYARSFKA
jgi:lysozyme family protein